MNKKQAVLVVCTNRKVYHDYFIEDTYEAGLELLGAEVKSVRQKELSLEGSFVRVENGQATVLNMHVKPFSNYGLAIAYCHGIFERVTEIFRKKGL